MNTLECVLPDSLMEIGLPPNKDPPPDLNTPYTIKVEVLGKPGKT